MTNYNDDDRYSRQTNMPIIGKKGQEKLAKAKVLVIGAGGLASPTVMYLAAAGIGTIGIADGDRVCLSNLNRQIMHPTAHVGMDKCVSAELAVKKFNPEINVKLYNYYVDETSIGELIQYYDFVIDAVDIIKTKYLINDACVKYNIPYCHAGVIKFEGQVMTWVPGDAPCYRCVFDEQDAIDVPTCAQVGVMGAVVGIIGCIEALEAIKYILGEGELLVGKMLVFDGLNMKTRIVKLPHKNEKCKACNKEIVIG